VLGSACWRSAQRDLHRAWDRMGRIPGLYRHTLNCWCLSLEIAAAAASTTSRASAASIAYDASAVDLACPSVVAGSGEEAVEGMSAGKARGLRNHRQDSRRQAYPHAHRTPVLYSRNQSRTNRALYEKRKGGGGAACRVALCELEMGTDRSSSGFPPYCPSHYPGCHLWYWVSYSALRVC